MEPTKKQEYGMYKREAQEELTNSPEKKFRAGAISATIWLNKGQIFNGVESKFKTISLERSYTDKEGKWHTTNNLRVNDLPKAQTVLQKAFEHIVLAEHNA